MSITVRQLEIFNAIVETKQVTRASKKLYLSQSAVSLALSELENQLGGLLFDRIGRSLFINDRGRYLLPLSQSAVDQFSKIETKMTELGSGVVGSLNIATSSTIGNYLMPYLITAFRKLYPDVIIKMLVANTKECEKLLMSRHVDLGFVEGELYQENIITKDWFEDELVVINKSVDAVKERSHTEDLAACLQSHKWIMREAGSGTAQIFKKKLGEYVSYLNIEMELGHTEAIKKAVEAGAGAGCLSSLAVSREIESGWVQKIELDGIDMSRQMSIIQHREKISTKVMKEFVNFCLLMRECKSANHCLTSPDKFYDWIDGITLMNKE